ncbi:MAG: dethiobiotin synthase [Phycisphaeraceae bacterium]
MLDRLTAPTTPGLFITGTDTGVGKTVIACAIAHALRIQRPQAGVAVLKPFATGCRKERGGLVNDDAEALAHFADCRLPLDVINPIRFRAPLAPAVAAEQLGRPIDVELLDSALRQADAYGDALIIEGAGGAMVPLSPEHPRLTWLDTRGFGLPAVVVARPNLGTLSHTAMTVKVLRDAGIKVAGVVVNGYEPDEAVAMADDPSRPDNPRWIAKMTGAKLLALVPRVAADRVQPQQGEIAPSVLDVVAAAADWWRVLGTGV